MARDDYHFVVYQLLSYLYQCLKNGLDVDEHCLSNNSKIIQINERYWQYIIINMKEQGLIDGLLITNAWGNIIISNLSSTYITPKGIEYLTENSFMKKAKKVYDTAMDIVKPFSIFK